VAGQRPPTARRPGRGGGVTRLPDFLVIGAMKAGTTTMYQDLRANPAIFLPEKELSALRSPQTDAGSYAALFAGAGAAQSVGEVSAPYAKLPEAAGTVERAVQILGSGFRVVYLVRDPVDRTVSHHFHRLARRAADPSIDTAVRSDTKLIDYSRYGMQIEPWVDAVGADNVHLVHFERYVSDRGGVLAEVEGFLGVPPAAATDVSAVHNRGDGRPVAVGVRGRLTRSEVYRRYVRPRLGEGARARLARAVLPTAPPRPQPPSAETVELVLERTAADCARLVELFGPSAPTWDADAARDRYARLRAE
jgi:sulfotransferase family protein